MFEKEAEEYTVENVCSSCYFEKPCENKCEAFGCADSKTYVLKAFKDGAEFGYYKAKKELKDAYKESVETQNEFIIKLQKELEEEKEEHKKEIETCGGFLKTLSYKDAWRLAWDKASVEERKQLFTLPNWDNEVFKEITGIDAEAELRGEE